MRWLVRRLVLVVAMTSVTVPAFAEDRRIVVVTVHGGSPAETRVLEATIRELLARLGLVMAAGGTGVLVTADIALDPAGPAKVIVRSSTGVTILDRSVPHDPNDAIEREQIAHAVRGAAEAELLVEQERSSAPAPAPAPPPVVVEPPAPLAPIAIVPVEPPVAHIREAPTHRFALDVAAFAGAGLFASETGPVGRAGGSLALSGRTGLRPSIAVAALYAFRFEADEETTVTARARVLSFRVLPGIEIVRRSRFALETAAGGGVDVLSVEPTSLTLPERNLAASSTRADPIVTGAVTAKIAVVPDVLLTVAFVMDVDLARRSYVFEDRGSRSTTFDPWSVRPMLLAGLSFTALGEAPFAELAR